MIPAIYDFHPNTFFLSFFLSFFFPSFFLSFFLSFMHIYIYSFLLGNPLFLFVFLQQR